MMLQRHFYTPALRCLGLYYLHLLVPFSLLALSASASTQAPNATSVTTSGLTTATTAPTTATHTMTTMTTAGVTTTAAPTTSAITSTRAKLTMTPTTAQTAAPTTANVTTGTPSTLNSTLKIMVASTLMPGEPSQDFLQANQWYLIGGGAGLFVIIVIIVVSVAVSRRRRRPDNSSNHPQPGFDPSLALPVEIPRRMEYVVTRPTNGEGRQMLQLRVGQTVHVLNQQNSNFWYVRDPETDKVGYVSRQALAERMPEVISSGNTRVSSNHLAASPARATNSEIYENPDIPSSSPQNNRGLISSFQPTHTEPSAGRGNGVINQSYDIPTLPPIQVPSTGIFYEAEFDFIASDDTFLTIKRGQILELMESSNNGWVRCHDTEAGKDGWVPGNYVKRLGGEARPTADEPSEMDMVNTLLADEPQNSDESLGLEFKVLYDFTGEQPEHLAIREGWVVAVFEQQDDGWSRGIRKGGDKEGYFPSSYVELIEDVTLDPEDLGLQLRQQLKQRGRSEPEELYVNNGGAMNISRPRLQSSTNSSVTTSQTIRGLETPVMRRLTSSRQGYSNRSSVATLLSVPKNTYVAAERIPRKKYRAPQPPVPQEMPSRPSPGASRYPKVNYVNQLHSRIAEGDSGGEDYENAPVLTRQQRETRF